MPGFLSDRKSENWHIFLSQIKSNPSLSVVLEKELDKISKIKASFQREIM
jgi:hypothetical protein